MAQLEELRLIAKTARLYYDMGYTQSKIAAQLDLSQGTISRLLRRAVEEQIVHITVSMPSGVFADLEEDVRQRYGLREVIVVDCESPLDKDIMRELGTTAAYYLENTIKKGEMIGISSWSETLLAMVDRMHRLSHQYDACVVQILGGIGHPDAEIHAARLIDRLAALVNGSAAFLPAPGIVDSEDARQIFMSDQYVIRALDMFNHVTLALVGIGTVEPSGLLASSGNIYSDEELDILREVGAVGDICLRFFDAQGQPVHTPLNNKVIGMDLDQLRQARRAVGIAGGERKQKAIRAVLVGGLINVLITDRNTAGWLMEQPA